MELLFNLPADSATFRALGAGWSVGDHLLATQLEALVQLLRVTVAVNTKNPRETLARDRPFRVPRPGDTEESRADVKVVASDDDIRRLLIGI